jgi:hypothetical protein
MPPEKPKKLQRAGESVVNIVAGSLVRPYIQKFLGKDWYKSVTVWGLVLWTTGSSLAVAVCETGALSWDFCGDLQTNLESIGQVLTVLGIRRK